jgi:hypothetical protein
MAKIIMNNVKITATNGGSIKNYDSVEINNSEMNFTGNNIDFHTDEALAIIREVIASGHQENLTEIIKLLKLSEPSKQVDVVKKSFLSKFLTGVKDAKPLIELLLKGSGT